jgi:hypothetical protein
VAYAQHKFTKVLERSPQALKPYHGGQLVVRPVSEGYQLLNFPDSQRGKGATNWSAPIFSDLEGISEAGRQIDPDFDDAVWVGSN